MSKITLNSVTKIYDDGTMAVEDVNLEIEDGEFLTLVGPSGSGKSTLLRTIAGLEEVTDGEIIIGDEVVNYLPPRSRDIAMVFQSYALYPHLSVRNNMAFGLKRSTDLTKAEINERVEETAEMMGISELLDNRPKHLSGGQRQRVATGRAIVREPAVFLFDEPLSNLDAKLRKHMRTELRRLQQRLGTTAVYVTHDQEEAMTMSDRIAILNHGKLQQVGAPREVYNQPHNLFVGQFIGSPSMNTFDVEYVPGPDGGRFQGDVNFPIPSDALGFVQGLDNRELTLGIRPEHIGVSLQPTDKSVPAHVDLIEPLGSRDLLYFTVDGEGLRAGTGSGETDDMESEDELKAFIEPMSVPDEYEQGDKEIHLTFDLEHLHVFDVVTGVNLRYQEEARTYQAEASPTT